MTTDLELIDHELRSPVAALAALAYAARSERASGRDVAEIVRLALLAAGDVERLVGDAAAFSVQVQPLDLVDLSRDLVGQSMHVHKGGIDVFTDAESLPVLGDPLRLRQVLMKLLDNAFAHGREHGLVSVHLAAEPARAVVSIENELSRPLSADPETLFERGARGQAWSSGSGLGLYVAREVARAHGGDVTVTATPARVSVRLVLPLASA